MSDRGAERAQFVAQLRALRWLAGAIGVAVGLALLMAVAYAASDKMMITRRTPVYNVVRHAGVPVEGFESPLTALYGSWLLLLGTYMVWLTEPSLFPSISCLVLMLHVLMIYYTFGVGKS